MLCTFTFKNSPTGDEPRTLVIRIDDIRTIKDTPDGTELAYLVHDALWLVLVTGTARENMERLQREELDTIATMYGHQQQQQARLQQNLPIPPVVRGKAGKR